MVHDKKGLAGVTMRLVKRPGRGFWSILEHRRVKSDHLHEPLSPTDAVGLIQGPVAAILAAADIAEKAAAVEVAEIRGVCPTHMTVIAVYGDTSAVEAAVEGVAATLGGTLFE